jgi:nucleoid-associated protein YgaU
VDRLAATYRGARILAAAGILLGGVALASLFRAPTHDLDRPLVDTGDVMVRRQFVEPSDRWSGSRPEQRGNSLSLFGGGPPGTVVKPLEPIAPPPLLPPSYEPGAVRATAGWEIPMADVSAGETARPRAPTIHKIVDGDTLAKLAQRYLGDPGRANELYQANRDLLSNPETLPIGAELKIVPSSDRRSRGTAATPASPLP